MIELRLRFMIFLFILSFHFVSVSGEEMEKTFLMKDANSSDTIYTGQITIQTSISNFPLADAQVKFTLIDSINQNSTIVFEGLTDANGYLMIDKLPIFESYVGIDGLNLTSKQKISITNNGTASDHGIRISLNTQNPVQAYILDIQGKVVDQIYMTFNPFTILHEGIWEAQHQKTGTYIFYAQTNSGSLAAKINHMSNLPGIISNSKNTFSNSYFLKESTTEDAKFRVEILSEVNEPFEQFVYLSENESKDFHFSLTHIPIADARIEGTVTMNQSILAPNAKMTWSNLFSDDEFVIYTDANGFYSKDDVPVPLDENFTNPEFTRYYLTVNIGDSITFKVDPVLLYSGELKTQNHNINLL